MDEWKEGRKEGNYGSSKGVIDQLDKEIMGLH